MNLLTGSLYHDEADLSIPNLGVPLAFGRHYDSIWDAAVADRRRDGPLGAGWLHAYGDFLTLEPRDEETPAGSTVSKTYRVWNRSDGNRSEFEELPSGGYGRPGGVYGEMVALGGSGHRYTETDGRFWEFDAGGRLTRIGDRFGSGVRLQYEGDKLVWVRDAETPELPSPSVDPTPDGRWIRFDYHQSGLAQGKVSTITDFTDAPDGTKRSWSFGYDEGPLFNPKDGSTTADVVFLAEVKGPDGPGVDDVHRLYRYHDEGRLAGLMKEMVSLNEPVEPRPLQPSYEVTNPSGVVEHYAVHKFDYYPNRRVFRVTDSEGHAEHLSYNQYYHSTTTTDANGNQTTYRFDPNGLTRKVVHPDGTFDAHVYDDPADLADDPYLRDSHTNALGFTETFEYYADGLSTGRGNLREHVHFDDRATHYDYSSEFNDVTAVAHLAPGGTEYRRSEIRYQYLAGNGGDLTGMVRQSIDPEGHPTTEVYDGLGRLESVTRPKGHQREPGGAYVKPAGSNLIARLDGAVPPHTTENVAFNDAGQATITVTDLEKDGDRQTIERQYDTRGNLEWERDPTGVQANFGYNVRDELVRSWLPAGGDPTPSGTIETHTKYADGKPVAVTDPRGNTTEHAYDTMDRLVRTVHPHVPGVGRAEEAREYDAAGNLVKVIDPLGRETRHVYDRRNRLVQTVHPDGAVELLRYDAAGRVTAAAAHRSLRGGEAEPGPYGVQPFVQATTKYDEAGRVISSKDAAGRETRILHHAQTGEPLVEQSFPDPLQPAKALQTTVYERDDLGRVIFVHAPEDAISTTRYDANGNVVEHVAYDSDAMVAGGLSLPVNREQAEAVQGKYKRVTTTEYDVADRPERTLLPHLFDGTRYERATRYDLAGRVVESEDESGRVTFNEYDGENGRLRWTEAQHDGSGITYAPPKTTYAYDANGNVLSEEDQAGRVTHYRYDALDRPTHTVNPTGDVSYVHTAPLPGRDPDDWRLAGAGHFLVSGGQGGVDGLDLVWQSPANEVRVQLLDRQGLEVGSVDLSPVPSPEQWELAAVDDFTGDGRLDLLWHSGSSGQTLIFEYKDDGNYAASRDLELAIPAGWRAAASGDFTGDGKTDLVLRHEAGEVVLWKLDPQDTPFPDLFLPVVDMQSLGTVSPASGWTLEAGGHFNGDANGHDGYPYADLLWRNTLTHALEAWLMTGDGSGGSRVGGSVTLPNRSPEWLVGGVADFSGPGAAPADGWGDVAWQHAETGASHLWVGEPRADGGALATARTEYDLAGQAVAAVDVLGRRTTFEHDARGRVVRTTLPEVETVAQDGTRARVAPEVTTDYDPAGNAVRHEDAAGVTTHTAHDELGRPVRTSRAERAVQATHEGDAVASVTLAGHGFTEGDAVEYRVATQDLAGRVTWHAFVGEAEVTDAGSFRVAGLAGLDALPATVVARAVRAEVVRSEYDRLTAAASPRLLTGTVDARGYRTTAATDGAGRTVETWQDTVPHAPAEATGATKQSLGRTVYNSLGELIVDVTVVHDPGVTIEVRHDYDGLGRKVRETRPDPDGAGPVAAESLAWEYNPDGTVSAAFDGFATQLLDGGTLNADLRQENRQTTTYEYDGLGRLVKEWGQDPDHDKNNFDGVVEPVVTEYTYNDQGNLEQRVDSVSGGDASDATTFVYGYDLLGRRTSEHHVQLDVGRIWQYDAVGNLTYAFDRNGRGVGYRHDAHDQLVQETWHGGIGGPAGEPDGSFGPGGGYTMHWGHDAAGRLTAAWGGLSDGVETNNVYAHAFWYDHLGRPDQEANYIDDPATGPYDHITAAAPLVTHRAAYNGNGQPAAVWAEIGEQNDLHLDAMTAYAYDHRGRLEELRRGTAAELAIGGHVTPLVTAATNPNDVVPILASYGHRGDGQLAHVTRHLGLSAGGPLAAQTIYGHDAAGRVTSLRHTDGAKPDAFGYFQVDLDLAGRPEREFSYYDGYRFFDHDEADRLDGIDIPHEADPDPANPAQRVRDEEFGFDARGNRTAANGDVARFGPGDRQTQGVDAYGTAWFYRHDAEGNLVLKSTADPSTFDYDGTPGTSPQVGGAAGDVAVHYRWDHRNRLAEVATYENAGGADGQTDPAAGRVRYAYDAFGRPTLRREAARVRLADRGPGGPEWAEGSSERYARPAVAPSAGLLVLDADGAAAPALRTLSGPGGAGGTLLEEDVAAGRADWLLPDPRGSTSEVVSGGSGFGDGFEGPAGPLGGTPAGNGAAWQELRGTWKLDGLGNAAYGGSKANAAVVEAGSADGVASVVVAEVSYGGPGLAARATDAGDFVFLKRISNGYPDTRPDASPVLQLVSWRGGGDAVIATGALWNLPGRREVRDLLPGDVLSLEAEGQKLRAYVNGYLLLEADDPNWQNAGTKWGLGGQYASGALASSFRFAPPPGTAGGAGGAAHRLHASYDAYGNVREAFDPATAAAVPPEARPRHLFQGAWFDPGVADAGLYLHAARWRDPGTGAFLSGDPAGLAFDPPNVHWFARGNPAVYSDPTGLGAFWGGAIALPDTVDFASGDYGDDYGGGVPSGGGGGRVDSGPDSRRMAGDDGSYFARSGYTASDVEWAIRAASGKAAAHRARGEHALAQRWSGHVRDWEGYRATVAGHARVLDDRLGHAAAHGTASAARAGWGEWTGAVFRGAAEGAKIGLKANVNAGAGTLGGFVSLGQWDPGEVWAVQDWERSDYGVSYAFARGGQELLLGVGTVGLANLSRGGQLARYGGQAVRAFDAAGNAAAAGGAAADVYAEGLNWSNGAALGASLLGARGDFADYSLRVNPSRLGANGGSLEVVKNRSFLPSVRFSRVKNPELADNIYHAQRAGHPAVLTHGGNTVANRAAALGGVPQIRGYTRDEYPFASSREGGAGAWIGHVPSPQQSSQGGIMANFIRSNNLRPGDQYRVVVEP